VEGFFVLASCHPKSPIFQKFGLPLGNAFLNMLAQDKKSNAPAEFHTWVAAQAIQINKGCEVVALTKSNIKPLGDIRDEFQFGKLIVSLLLIPVKRKLIHLM
jgi:hypothetical protein